MAGKATGLTQSEFGGSGPVKNPPPPPPPSTPQAPKRKMIEVEAPELFKFKVPGDFVEGVLLSIEPVDVNKKRCIQYLIGNGRKRYQILGTYDINAKLSLALKGLWVQITFKDYSPDVEKNGNKMMLFEVLAEEKSTAKFMDGTEITDDDIPF